MQIKIDSINQIDKAADAFIQSILNEDFNKQKIKCVAFYGSMGAGKTTFIKSLCKQLGSTDTVNSPTFAIINEYKTPNIGQVFHFDFYRINKQEEAYDFGYEDYFYSGNICLIEWPEKIENLLPDETIKIRIEESNDSARILTLLD